MHSMTGYGKAEKSRKDISVAVELFSVNSRFLEFTMRLPKQIMFLESKIKELIQSKISRGKITIVLNYEDRGLGVDRLVVNRNQVEEVHKTLSDLKKKYKLSGDIEIGHFISFPEIFRMEKAADIEGAIWPVMEKAIGGAADELVRMRKREGDNLKTDLDERLGFLSKRIEKINKLAPQNVEKYREKLTERVQKILGENSVDSKRMEEEVLFHAERSDITEECVRFESHIKLFKRALGKKEPIGKKLNFILQELNREANTIGAKAGGTEISHLVMELKEEIEKMREQVQNIE